MLKIIDEKYFVNYIINIARFSSLFNIKGSNMESSINKTVGTLPSTVKGKDLNLGKAKLIYKLIVAEGTIEGSTGKPSLIVASKDAVTALFSLPADKFAPSKIGDYTLSVADLEDNKDGLRYRQVGILGKKKIEVYFDTESTESSISFGSKKVRKTKTYEKIDGVGNIYKTTTIVGLDSVALGKTPVAETVEVSA